MTPPDSTYNNSPFILPEAVQRYSTYDQSPLESASVTATTRVKDVWSNGIEPAERADETQPYSGAVALLIAIVAIIAFEAPQLRRIISGLDTDLLGVRRRANAFDSHTSAERRTLGLLIILGCVCQAILLGTAINPSAVSNGPLLGALTGLTTGYYLFQYAACGIIGYTFTDSINASQWLKGLNLSQGISGLSLVVPAITVLYYQEAGEILLFIALILYIIVRIAYICKGFRIFYNHLPSIVYFILYLCALEIIPVIWVVAIAQNLDQLM